MRYRGLTIIWINILAAFSLVSLKLPTISWVTLNCRFFYVRSPSHFLHLLSIPSATGALIMEMTYGMEIESHEDKFLQAVERVAGLIGRAVEPGAFLVNTFPICLSPNSGSL